MSKQNSKQVNDSYPESSLQKAILLIYMADSDSQLQKLIEEDLPSLCHVHFIELKPQKPKRNPLTFVYSFQYLQEEYFICFDKKTSFSKEDKSFLKKIAKALQLSLITLEKQKNLEIHKSSWEQAFDAIASPICLTSLEGAIIRTNKAFRLKSQMTKEQLQQKNYFFAFFGKEETEKYIAKAVRKVNGKECVFSISKQPVSTNIQLVVLRDITEQEEMEKTAAQTAKEAELGILSSSIAHELNNPIAGIQLLLQSLQVELAKNSNTELQEDLEEMLSAVQKCANTINELLNP